MKALRVKPTIYLADKFHCPDESDLFVDFIICYLDSVVEFFVELLVFEKSRNVIRLDCYLQALQVKPIIMIK